MPTDTKRNQGPDDSEDYHIYEKIEDTLQENIKQLRNGLRLDGRNVVEQRKIYLKTGVNSRIKGSAYIEIGNTKVAVSVYEPREIPRLAEFCANGELFCELRISPFARKTRRNLMMQSDEKDLSLELKKALEPAVCRGEFPNCQVDVYALILDDDGSAFTAAITAAGVALADAGIPMYDTVGAVTMGISGGHSFIDPNRFEEEVCTTTFDQDDCGLFTMAYLTSLGQISNISLCGSSTMDCVLRNLDLMIQKCTDVSELAKVVLTNDALRKSQLSAKEAEEESNENDTER